MFLLKYYCRRLTEDHDIFPVFTQIESSNRQRYSETVKAAEKCC